MIFLSIVIALQYFSFLTDRSKAVFLLWICLLFVFASCQTVMSVCYSLKVTRLGRADILALLR